LELFLIYEHKKNAGITNQFSHWQGPKARILAGIIIIIPPPKRGRYHQLGTNIGQCERDRARE